MPFFISLTGQQNQTVLINLDCVRAIEDQGLPVSKSRLVALDGNTLMLCQETPKEIAVKIGRARMASAVADRRLIHSETSPGIEEIHRCSTIYASAIYNEVVF